MAIDGFLKLARDQRLTLMTERANVYRATVSADGAGGSTSSESVVLSNVACFIGQPQGSREREIAERLGLAQPVAVTFPYGTDVRNGDRVAVNGRSLRVVQELAVGTFIVDARYLCSEVA